MRQYEQQTKAGTMKRRILVVEQDLNLQAQLREALAANGFTVGVADHPRTALKLISSQQQPQQWDLVIVGAKLPELDGPEFCRQIRERHSMPVLLVDSVSDSGGTSSPADIKELLQQVQSALHGQERIKSAQVLTSGNLKIDVVQRTAFLKDENLELTASEFAVLALLAQNPQTIFSRDQLMEALRGTEWEAFNRSLDVLISRLRHKLQDKAKLPIYIKTVWGTGYAFVATVEPFEPKPTGQS
jgi:DNA-binding response OmpR family regulator